MVIGTSLSLKHQLNVTELMNQVLTVTLNACQGCGICFGKEGRNLRSFVDFYGPTQHLIPVLGHNRNGYRNKPFFEAPAQRDRINEPSSYSHAECLPGLRNLFRQRRQKSEIFCRFLWPHPALDPGFGTQPQWLSEQAFL